MLISTGGTIRGKISPISAVIHQEINGEYSCHVSIPLEDNLAEYFIADAIVYLDDANGKTQQFRLERPERTLDALTAFGWHITYDLAQDMVVSKKYTSAAGSTVWADLLQAGIQETRFAGTADSSDTNSLTIVRQSVLSALIGDQDNSYLSRWGGEIDRDNFTVAMKTQLGEDRDYRVIYRKNLTGIHVTVDQSTVVNRIVPTYLNENDAATLLPEVYIDADSIAETAVPHARHIHYSDIRVGAEVDEVVPYPTTASAEAEVRTRVAALYASGIDVPLLTVEIGFVQLRNTLEYADYAALEIVQLGDTIGAEYEDHSWTSRVVAYDWDAVLGRYNNITLGNVRPSASDMSNSIVDAATIAANAALYQRTSELTGAISAAQTTANGKNTVYYSSTEPTGGTYVENDIWFDTDNSNKMYLHDGSAWVAVQFGENAIADLAITNAKIADATISNAKIANIDAGKVTTGYLGAARIEAGTITFDKLASTAVTDITDTIDLGGRNLLRNTGSSVANASYLIASYDMGDEWPVAGETYTLSVKFTLGADRTHLSLFTPEGTVLLTTVANADKNSLGVASKTFTMSYAVGYTPVAGYTNLVVYQMPSGGSAASTIEWVKLEKGNKATDWTPAPEDKLSEGVSYAGTEITAANGMVTTATIAGKDASLTMNATKVIEYLFDGKKRFGLSTDGYVFANRLYDPDDESAYVQIGAVPGETGRSALTVYQTIGTGYTTHRERLRLKSFGTTAFAIQGIVKPIGTDVEGTTMLTVEHGDSYLILSDVFGMAYLRHGDLNIGIDDPDIYISKDNSTTKFKIPEIQTGTITLNDTTGVSVTFANEFTGTPRIVLTAQTSKTGTITAKVTAKSATGFTAIIGGTVSGNIAFDWIAMSSATE